MKKSMKHLILSVSLLLIISLLSTGAFATQSETEAPSEETPVMSLPVEVLVEGELPEEPELFRVSLIPEQENAPMPEGSEDGAYVIEIKGGEKDYIRIPCHKLGVYNYTIRILPGENINCVYSTDVYHITLFILNADNGGFDITAVAYRNDAEEKSEIVFVNRYVNSDTAVVEAVKLLDGETPEDGAFTFTLSDEAGNVIAEARNVGKSVRFPELRCYEEGTFRYTVREVKGEDPDIIYDTAVFDVILEVTRDEERNFVAALRYEKNGTALEGLPVFENITSIPQIPQTGDDHSVIFFLMLMVISGVGIAVLLVFLTRSERRAREDRA